MPFANKFREKLQEKRDEQQADVHSVHIGIGCNNNLVVTQIVNAFFNVQRCLQQVEFFVFVNHFFGESEGIQRFPPQTENGLRIYIARFGDGTTGRVTLGNKNA
jgi:hypothetical protein